MELRELIARAAWAALPRLYDEEPRPGSALYEGHVRANEATDRILAALDAAGLVVVPKSFVAAVTDYVTYEKGTNKGFASRWEALKEAASPFAKKEVG